MTGEYPKGQIDHIRTDNRFVNLRVVNNQENHLNRPMQRNNKTGFVGVSVYARTGKYISSIYYKGKQNHLGVFDNLEEAIEARKKANIEYGFSENHGNGYGVSKTKPKEQSKCAQA